MGTIDKHSEKRDLGNNELAAQSSDSSNNILPVYTQSVIGSYDEQSEKQDLGNNELTVQTSPIDEKLMRDADRACRELFGEDTTSEEEFDETQPNKNTEDEAMIMPDKNTEDEAMVMLSVEQDYTATMNLLQITLLTHYTKDCIICQPNANYRPLSLSNVMDADFIKSMQQKHKNITEEMYLFLYEVQIKENITEVAQQQVDIYPTYKTDRNTDDLVPIANKYAIFPTDQSLIKLAEAFKIKIKIQFDWK
jgi:hypothetical protein